MSYLLTEIALEMLGYKFYDTNGVFHLTNFQQSTATAQADLHPDEPSLIEFINQPDDIDSQQNGHEPSQTSSSSAVSTGSSVSVPPTSSIKVDFKRTPVRALSKIITQENDQVHNGHEEQQNARANVIASNASSVILSKRNTHARRTPAKALAKIINYERTNIRSQLKKRLESAYKLADKKHVEECFKMEKEKLLADAKEMKRFRTFLEERLRRIDSRPHETYLRTFGTD